MKDLTIVVLTMNEEADLPRCLLSLEGFGRLVVVDSGSTDQTRQIAIDHGSLLLEHPFEAFGAQRNWALDQLNLKSPDDWILFLDADEVATINFRSAVERAIDTASNEIAGFFCCCKMLLNGVWLKNSDNFPKWQVRLIRNQRVRFIDVGHGQKEGTVIGMLQFLREPYLHYGFSKGWSAWIHRHNRYATLEANERSLHKARFSDIFVASPTNRNKTLKLLLGQLPGWPLGRFLFTYVLRGGFLEGQAGLSYCLMLAYYELIIQLKMTEIRLSSLR
ncbi:glycosyltransferase family 2 protein [Synechococcus sp. CBW1108]|uniref:glycosyltransferase family 2 protein n=1 Tax=Synechococcus sp. CBW1108 TaxID=1353147 RepID=UPI0018CE2698|nr:glycosyltransferase family 2 protein [Synechococcus sp. CBW1108]QPN69538.1 glycosyltransferase family 2 protein [Synechococcus sp. CBW1108]